MPPELIGQNDFKIIINWNKDQVIGKQWPKKEPREVL
jgi:hypothetical protein